VDEELHRAHTGDGIAIFACGGEDAWEVIASQRPFQNQFLISTRPLIRQLAVFLDEHEAVVAAVLDRRAARIFEISIGEAVHETDVKSDVPREVNVTSTQGWGDLKYQRDVRGHIEQHFRDVAYELTRLVDDQGYRRVVLLGQEAVLQNFRKSLPKRVAERVIATGPADMRAPRDRILAQVRDIVAVEEKRQERELIGLVRDQALSGNLGVFGLEATVNALRKGQVYKLAISDDLKVRGWRCRGCGALATHLKKDACPHCGGGTDVVELGDEIVKDALGQGAEIETVRSSAELNRMGKVGALLRFRD
jgi:peptide chain release factor subunit 1